jgi:hypothetical protein
MYLAYRLLFSVGLDQLRVVLLEGSNMELIDLLFYVKTIMVLQPLNMKYLKTKSHHTCFSYVVPARKIVRLAEQKIYSEI